MDILIVDGRVREIFENGAPELHPDLFVLKNFTGEVKDGWVWDETTSTFSEPIKESIYFDNNKKDQDTTVITMRQCRLQLLADGLLSTVEKNISSMGEASRIEWEYATEVDRGSELVLNLQTLLNLTDEQIDTMFISASSL